VTRNMKRVPSTVFVGLTVAGLSLAGCAKKDAEETPLPPPSVTTLPANRPLPDRPSPAQTNFTAAATVSSADTNSDGIDAQTQAELATQLKQLVNEYDNTADFQKRVTLIYEISGNDDAPDVVDALAHLFLNEQDQELKIELVNSLGDVDGQNDKKLAILSSALRPDQPREVRQEAVDAMGDLQDKRGIQILQSYSNDPDPDLKDTVQDTIDQLQKSPETPPGTSQPQSIPH